MQSLAVSCVSAAVPHVASWCTSPTISIRSAGIHHWCDATSGCSTCIWKLTSSPLITSRPWAVQWRPAGSWRGNFPWGVIFHFMPGGNFSRGEISAVFGRNVSSGKFSGPGSVQRQLSRVGDRISVQDYKPLRVAVTTRATLCVKLLSKNLRLTNMSKNGHVAAPNSWIVPLQTAAWQHCH